MELLYKYRSLIGLLVAPVVGVASYLTTERRTENQSVMAVINCMLVTAALLYVIPRLLDPHSRRRWFGISGLAIAGTAFVWPGYANFFSAPALTAAIFLSGRIISKEDLEKVGRNAYERGDALGGRSGIQNQRLLDELNQDGHGLRFDGLPARPKSEIIAEHDPDRER